MSSYGEILNNYLADSVRSFRQAKKLAEKAIEQVSDDEFFETIDAESNSIALIVKHVAGNLRSRWTDFLTTDGEKGFRDRDAEFELIADTRETITGDWESGWSTLFASLEPLTIDDLSRVVTIRGEPHTIVEAINRQLTHYSYHVGQIVLLAKHFRSAEWSSLSIPRNRSAQFNQFLASRRENGELKIDRLGSVDAFTKEKSEP